MAPKKSATGRSKKAPAKKTSPKTAPPPAQPAQPVQQAEPTAVPVTAPAMPEESQNKKKVIAAVLVVVALAIVAGVAYWFTQRNNTAPPAGLAVTKAATTTTTTKSAITTTKAATVDWLPVTSCTLNGIDACNTDVFITSKAENGRLHNDTSTPDAFVQAVTNGLSDINTRWRLRRQPSGLFQIVSSANNSPLRVLLPQTLVAGTVSCDTRVNYDVTKLGTDGVAAEFMIGFNSTQNAYQIMIPSGYISAFASMPLGLISTKTSWGANKVTFARSGLLSNLWTFQKAA